MAADCTDDAAALAPAPAPAPARALDLHRKRSAERRSIGKENMFMISQEGHARYASRLRLDVREKCLDEETKARHMNYFLSSIGNVERARQTSLT